MPERVRRILTLLRALFASHGLHALLGITGLRLSCVFAAHAPRSVRVNAAVLIELPARSEFSLNSMVARQPTSIRFFINLLSAHSRAAGCLPGAWVMPQKMAAGTGFLGARFPRRSMPTSGEGLLRRVRPSALPPRFIEQLTARRVLQ